ncbi:MAG TPA: ROK family protein [Vicinamibacterales bacterium]|nr:ROK family protein [Vicinamibacterales bacterium]
MRLGIDLGGTKISAVVLDDDGREVWRTRVATPRGDYAGTIGAIGGLVEQAEQAVGARCTVGLGIPGAPSRVTGRIKNANSSWLNDQPLHQDLEQRLNRPVRLANDANCLVLSEVADGAAAGARTVFGVILGTGVGGGLFVNGALVEGVNAIGGEWGHNPLPWPDASEMHGDACYCGRSGCIETWLSGPGLARDYSRAGGELVPGEEVVARAGLGEARAGDTLARWEARLARALATVINLVDPDVIVVGGGLSRIERLYTRVPAQWADWVFSDVVATRLVPALHGDDSGVRGAARLY